MSLPARVLGCALVAVCGLAAAGDDIYLYKNPDGSRAYTDRKPLRRPYVRIENTARPTAAASCMGLTQAMLDRRAETYSPLIRKHAAIEGVQVSLVRAVMRVESCFDRRAVSRSGARGLMQLMPQTAQLMGVQDSFDAEQNIRGGVRYLRQMLDRFRQNTRLALAAYNAGPTAVDQHGGIPPFDETRDYVKRVMADYQRNKSRGLDTPA